LEAQLEEIEQRHQLQVCGEIRIFSTTLDRLQLEEAIKGAEARGREEAFAQFSKLLKSVSLSPLLSLSLWVCGWSRRECVDAVFFFFFFFNFHNHFVDPPLPE
jgi:hypothetical protein